MAQVIWTPSADEDIESIIDYYSARSEKYAEILVQNIFDKKTNYTPPNVKMLLKFQTNSNLE